ncbi:hypothetical protein B9479_002190 [Cryptococcus floricola]|uniref:RBR-type E3 ubiquitin transferase n=1 Tax=Cryptococcus floricola TaxID=2591691 RepID=A0A5D3B3C4_9TREE|nr:hypothetical protein B9479_002190 [Cryptococcus floricola]
MSTVNRLNCSFASPPSTFCPRSCTQRTAGPLDCPAPPLSTSPPPTRQAYRALAAITAVTRSKRSLPSPTPTASSAQPSPNKKLKPSHKSTKPKEKKPAKEAIPPPALPEAAPPTPKELDVVEKNSMSSDGENEDFEFEDDDYDEDGFGTEDMDSASEPDAFDALSPNVDDGPPKKPYDVAYKILDLDQITAMQQGMIDDVVSLLAVPMSTASALLRHFSWNREKLQEAYWTDPDSALLAAGLDAPSSPSQSSKSLPRSSQIRSFECPICFSDYEGKSASQDTFSMGCGHRFCNTCWGEYLKGKVKDEGESGRIQCMESGCKHVINTEMVDALSSGDVSRRQVHSFFNGCMSNDRIDLRFCPHPECQYITQCTQAPARMLTQLVPTVECLCKRPLCFGCGYADSHRPVICKIVKYWEKKCADDSETSNWLSANTKECPKCNSIIEKNGGCNHMTCKKCKWEFCWVCMGPWTEHGTAYYQCNRYDEKSGLDARDAQTRSRADLERYLHYFNRWANHTQSAKLDTEFYAKTERKMEVMQHQANLSWIEVQFAKEAMDVVVKARITLKWSYCMAYYLQRNNQTELFEDNQRDLEGAVENLSFLLESNIGDVEEIAKLRLDVTNQAAYVQKRHEILLDDTLRGYMEHRWKFSVDV